MKTFLTSIAGLTLIASAAGAQTETLTVYTYDSFTPDYGPGPQIEEGFEAQCGCDLEFVAAGDGAALLSRLRLEGERTEADVVLGLDTNLMAQAEATGLFQPAEVEAEYDLPIEWESGLFVPYDWSYFAFVGNEEADAPRNFEELAESDLQIAIEDPRSSTPGLGLVLWVKKAYGDEAPEIWEGLSDNILTVTSGWSEAYGLFTDGEVDAVLSYTTSPAYHVIAEDDGSKVAWPFEEGMYMQVEVAGMTTATDQPELAREFLQYLTGPEAQGVLPTTNWMYPAVMPEDGLPEGFGEMLDPEQALLYAPEEAEQVKEAAIEEWRAALSQ